MDQSFLQHPFVIGLLVGLLVCSFVWVQGLLARRALHREIGELKGSLFTKLKIETKAQVQLDAELEQLRRQNENMRITIASLQQKPARAELRQLHLYDRALHMMLANAPGFAPAWEEVMKQAEREMRESETGVGAFVRKVFAPLPPSPRSSAAIDVPAPSERKDEGSDR